MDMGNSYIYTAAMFTTRSLVLAVVFLLGISIYRLFLHPLARIPGPRLAAISNVWHAYHARNGHMLHLGKTLHKHYGHTVRVGPNEVWFDSKEALSKIYSATQGFEKSNFYIAMSLHRPTLDTRGNLVLPDTLDFLAEFDMHRYRLQRRLIGSTYQISSLLKYEHAVDEVMRNALIQLRDLNGAQVDLKEWMHIVTVECLTAIALSWSPGYLRSNTDGGSSSHAYLGWRRKSVFGLFPWAEIADSYNRAFGRLFAKAWGLTFKTPSNFKPFFPAVGTKVSKRVNAALRPNPAKDARKDLAAELIQLHKDKPDFNEQYLRRMIMTNFGAGHETTTSTLISVLAMLGTHTEAQARVHAETDRLATDRAISYQDAVGMTFTQAAIKEAQRLHPVLGMSPSRTVPAGGTYINGYYLLPKTIVGCNPVSLHRNPDIFGPDSDHFIPERWLDRGDTKDMDRCNLIWGGGARTCPGRNLAQMIVYKVVAALMREFRVEVEMPPEEAVKYYFMAMLTGVKVRFLERTKEETLE